VRQLPEPGAQPGLDPGRAALVRLVRDEGRRVLATLVRTTGSLPLAEDAVQDAVVRALETWPRTGVPAEPRGWLTLTARRRAIDLLRREATRVGKEIDAVALLDPDDDPPAPDVVADDLLRLLFICCHPSLALETQVALALRTLCGLSTAEVARALLLPEATAAKRLTRARQKIAVARIPYRVPPAAELPARLRAVTATVYLVFTEGHNATDGDDPLRAELTDEALRLARLLHQLLPDEAAVLGLLALLLLTDARRAARLDPAGEPVLLADQDRGRWDRDAVREGVELLGRALRRTPDRPVPYVWSATDWAAIVSWYDVLVTVADTPVVRLNRAVAVGERDGAAAGLAELDLLAGLPGLSAYPPWCAARAELLVRVGRRSEALRAYDEALALPGNAAQHRHLLRRRALAAAVQESVPGPRRRR